MDCAYILKIGDFGLARDLDYDEDYCTVRNRDRKMPWKWMALEAMQDLKWSVMSDVVSTLANIPVISNGG